MSEFFLLCADSALWDPTTSATWGSLNFCPKVTQFQVHTITQGQLTTLSQVGACRDVEKPHQDMAFLLIVTSLAIGCEWVFGLTAMWMHPHQIHLPPWQMWLKSYCYWQMKVPTGHMPTSKWTMPWPTCCFPVRGTLASWLVTYLVGMPVAACANNLCGSCCNAEAGWFAQMGIMGDWNPLCSTSRSYHSGTWPAWVNPPEIHPWWMWTYVTQYTQPPLHPSRRPSQSELKASNRTTTTGLPSCPSFSLTIPCLQDTNSVSGPGSSSPNRVLLDQWELNLSPPSQQ